MHLDLTSDQELFVETSRRFIESSYPLTTVRENGQDGGGPEYRGQAAALGWYAMLVPESLGGGSVSGNGVLDAALIAEVRGATLQPGPFIGTNVVAHLLAEDGTDEQRSKILPSLVSGDQSATWAVTGPGSDGDPVAGVTAESRGNSWLLAGSKMAVQDVDSASWMLVTARSDGGPSQFILPAGTEGVVIRPMEGLDLTRRFCEVRFEGVEVPEDTLVGGFASAAGAVERQLQIACVLNVAEAVGAMDHDFEMAVQYSKDRIAFGRPIGSFQAVKHLLADTSLLLEMSKAMAESAAEAVGSGQSDAGEVASMAKAFVSESAIQLAQSCFQSFGGIGYTWEHDQHLYLRRLTMDAALYGDVSWHRERLCVLKGL